MKTFHCLLSIGHVLPVCLSNRGCVPHTGYRKMDGLVGYGSDDSENSKNSPAPKSEEKVKYCQLTKYLTPLSFELRSAISPLLLRNYQNKHNVAHQVQISYQRWRSVRGWPNARNINQRFSL